MDERSEVDGLIEPRTLAAIGGAIAVFLGILVGLMPDDVKAPFWGYQFTAHLWVFVVVTAIFLWSCLWALNYVSYSGRRSRSHLETALDLAQRQLRQSDFLRFFDEVTGIPNQRKLRNDFDELIKQSHQPVMIMLDLDGFGSINNRFGYEKGDAVIRYIANDTSQTMRRNEDIYKMPSEQKAGLLRRVIYRKYSGGDEFVIVLNGGERAALGFLGRLKDRFDYEISQYICNEILKHPWPVKFHAGVSTVEIGDSLSTAIERVETCLRMAKQEGSTSRVIWLSRKTAADFAPKSPDANTYAEAETAFALAANP